MLPRSEEEWLTEQEFQQAQCNKVPNKSCGAEVYNN